MHWGRLDDAVVQTRIDRAAEAIWRPCFTCRRAVQFAVGFFITGSCQMLIGRVCNGQ
jgi:hypothetical protein